MRPMEIQLRLSEGQATDDLLDFFHRREMPARRLEEADCLAVELPAGLQERHARQEIELLLRVWQLMHPNVAVDVI
jgi:hypothetical protein